MAPPLILADGNVYLTYVAAAACTLNCLVLLLTCQQIVRIAFPRCGNMITGVNEGEKGSIAARWTQPILYNVVFVLIFLVPSVWWLNVASVPDNAQINLACVVIEPVYVFVFFLAAAIQISKDCRKTTENEAEVTERHGRRRSRITVKRPGRVADAETTTPLSSSSIGTTPSVSASEAEVRQQQPSIGSKRIVLSLRDVVKNAANSLRGTNQTSNGSGETQETTGCCGVSGKEWSDRFYDFLSQFVIYDFR